MLEVVAEFPNGIGNPELHDLQLDSNGQIADLSELILQTQNKGGTKWQML